MSFATPFAILGDLPQQRKDSAPNRDAPDEVKPEIVDVNPLAERASISRTTLTNIEKGDGGVALGNYAKALFALGLLDRLAEVADVRHDETGLAIASEQLPKRVRQRRSWR